jgi:RNA polymerase sigma-70 factor (ECF subfamily)
MSVFCSEPLAGGDHVSLRECLVANYNRLHRRLLQYLGCPDRASDCLHDAWIHLSDSSLPAGVRHPEAYVYRVARNLAIDSLRAGKSMMSLDDLGETDALVDPFPGPDRVAESRSELAAVDRAVQCLPYRDQSILFDLRIQECSRGEVARRVGLSTRRVDTVLRQTLDYCAARLEGGSMVRRYARRMEAVA